MNEKIKICFTSSSGGHTTELLKLYPLMEEHDHFIIAEKSNADFSKCKKVYYLKQVNRKQMRYIFSFLFSFFRIYKILKKEKPTYIISVGSMSTIPVCVIGKMLKMKVIYVESFARVYDLSVTGKILYKMADLFVVQWKALADLYDKAVYGGGLF